MRVKKSIINSINEFGADPGIGVNLQQGDSINYKFELPFNEIKGLSFLFYNKKHQPTITFHQIKFIYGDSSFVIDNTESFNSFQHFGIDSYLKNNRYEFKMNQTKNGQNYSRMTLAGNALKELYSLIYKSKYSRSNVGLVFSSENPGTMEFYFNDDQFGNIDQYKAWIREGENNLNFKILTNSEIGTFGLTFKSKGANTNRIKMNSFVIDGVRMSKTDLSQRFTYIIDNYPREADFDNLQYNNNVIIKSNFDFGKFKSRNKILFSFILSTIILYFISIFFIKRNILVIH